MGLTRPLLAGLRPVIIAPTLGPRLIWTGSCQSSILKKISSSTSSHNLVNRRDVTFQDHDKSPWRHLLLKTAYNPPSLMGLRQSRQQSCHISHFFGLLDSRAYLLSIHLINKAEGSLSLSPSCLFASSSSSRRPNPRALPPPSIFASDSTTAAASTWPHQRNAAILRCFLNISKFFFSSL